MDQVKIGNFIAERRRDKNLTQMQLAVLVGSTPCQISFWETGRAEPNVFNCVLLADALDVTLDELCCRDFKGVK